MKSTSHEAQFTLFKTAIGICAIVWTRAGIRRLLLPEANRSALLDKLQQLPARPHDEGVPPYVVYTVRYLTRHLAGKMAHIGKVKLDPYEVSPFRMQVYRALQQVPAGTTVSYGELAALAGSPGAARAVGSAMATNPWPLLVPCHRVLAADGKVGGFSAHGGVVTKRKLLAIEGKVLPKNRSKAAAPPPKPTQQPPPKPSKKPAPTLLDGRRPLPYDTAEAVAYLRRADPEFARWMSRVGACTMSLKPMRTLFAALAEAIVYQQLSGKAAGAIYARVIKNLASRGTLRAKDVAGVSAERLRELGLSRAKAAAILDLADKTQTRALPSRAAVSKMPEDEAAKRLTVVRGVGPWTVHMLLMFQFGRPDVGASGDYGLRKGLGVMLGRDEVPSAAEFEAHSERWRPYRSVASWYLWRLLELPA